MVEGELLQEAEALRREGFLGNVLRMLDKKKMLEESIARMQDLKVGIRSMTHAPMFREGEAIGTVLVMRREPGGLDESQLALLKTFADQAVIAIENARLFNETQEALAHQTASADILRVISGSPTDVQPVFEAIVGTAVERLGCDLALVQTVSGDTYSPKAMATPAGLAPVPGASATSGAPMGGTGTS